jgi:hypothetical protein
MLEQLDFQQLVEETVETMKHSTLATARLRFFFLAARRQGGRKLQRSLSGERRLSTAHGEAAQSRSRT